jgi:hypothetical protein
MHISHRRLRGAHVGARDVVGALLDRPGERAHHPLVISRWQAGPGRDAGLPAAVPQPGHGVLERHGAGQAGHLTSGDIMPDADAPYRWAERDIVDDHDRLDAIAQAQEDHFRRAKFVSRPADRLLGHYPHPPTASLTRRSPGAPRSGCSPAQSSARAISPPRRLGPAAQERAPPSLPRPARRQAAIKRHDGLTLSLLRMTGKHCDTAQGNDHPSGV